MGREIYQKKLEGVYEKNLLSEWGQIGTGGGNKGEKSSGRGRGRPVKGRKYCRVGEGRYAL